MNGPARHPIVVIKGNARAGAAKLAAHLQRVDTNEVMNVLELRGVLADDLHTALAEMEAVASGARSKRPFYHASINTRADEAMTPAQRDHAIDQLEASLGLTGQPRVVVEHVKYGRAHTHVVWSRIDLENMKAISDSFNYRRHEEVGRALEQEFGHARVQGAHVERDGQARPERTPSHAEMQQAERTGYSAKEMTATVTELWRTTDSGQALVAALADQGWLVAQGDRRDFVIVDEFGEVHSLARRIQGAKAPDVRERMRDVDTASLPDVTTAKQLQAEFEAAQVQEQAPEPAARTNDETAPTSAGVRKEATSDPASGPGMATAAPEITPDQVAEPTPDMASQPLAEPPRGILQEVVTEPAQGLSAAQLERSAAHVADVGVRLVGPVIAVADEMMNAVDEALDFFIGSPAPRQITAAEFATDPTAQRDYLRQQAAEREAAAARQAALDQMARDQAAGKNVRPEDIRNLRHDDLETIKAKGDEGVRDLIRQHEKERRHEYESGRQRERERR